MQRTEPDIQQLFTLIKEGDKEVFNRLFFLIATYFYCRCVLNINDKLYSNDKKTFAALLSKEIGGNISEKERTELQQTLTEARRMKEIYDEIHTFMQEKELQNTPT